MYAILPTAEARNGRRTLWNNKLATYRKFIPCVLSIRQRVDSSSREDLKL